MMNVRIVGLLLLATFACVGAYKLAYSEEKHGGILFYTAQVVNHGRNLLTTSGKLNIYGNYETQVVDLQNSVFKKTTWNGTNFGFWVTTLGSRSLPYFAIFDQAGINTKLHVYHVNSSSDSPPLWSYSVESTGFGKILISENGVVSISASHSQNLYVYWFNISTGHQIVPTWVTSMNIDLGYESRISADGKILAVMLGNQVQVVDISSGKPTVVSKFELDIPPTFGGAMHMSPSGSHLLFINRNYGGTVYMYSASSSGHFSLAWSFNPPTNERPNIVTLSNSNVIIGYHVKAANQIQWRLYSLNRPSTLWMYNQLTTGSYYPIEVQFSDDGKTIVGLDTAETGPSVVVFSTEKGFLWSTQSTLDAQIVGIANSGANSYFVTVAGQGILNIYETNGGI
eukprot:TRINITY_DN2368_c0_g1_i1.p1 TRINITY_DN2368_c0_g1~~TRINITY_DN2368_c0_g1_i1.p1  ORF type:complete len:397 (-),score=32.48 TRINITY_DN2368_c0_g1_i1:56-1246(-)